MTDIGVNEISESSHISIMEKRLNHALWLLMELDIHRYLQANTVNRWDGASKATHHINLCEIYIASIMLCKPKKCLQHRDYYERIHRKTQGLTSYLDEKIGFPLDSQPTHQEYIDLSRKFFTEFITLANMVEINDGDELHNQSRLY